MVQRDDEGNLFFEGIRSRPSGEILEVYIWEKANFEKHEFKHRISDAIALAEIEQTIFDPDVITSGPQKKKRNLYRVMAYREERAGRAIKLWRVHCFSRGGRYYVIATAFDGWSPIEHAIHYLEEIVWKKPDSKI